MEVPPPVSSQQDAPSMVSAGPLRYPTYGNALLMLGCDRTSMLGCDRSSTFTRECFFLLLFRHPTNDYQGIGLERF